MTRVEHLLASTAEECAEVAQRATKALRFGLTEVQPGQEKTNAERIEDEFYDLVAVVSILQSEGHLPQPDPGRAMTAILAKKEKFGKFFTYSEQCGTVDNGTPPGEPGEYNSRGGGGAGCSTSESGVPGKSGS